MEFFGFILALMAGFVLGTAWGPRLLKKLVGTTKDIVRSEPLEIVPINPDLIGAPKPGGLYADYSIEELEKHKRFLDRDYRDNVNYPNTRWTIAQKMKEVLRMLEWHYANVAAQDYIEQRARNRRELDAFDELYGRALKGIG